MSDAGRPSPRLIRKPLDRDCLLHGEIHPSISERLQRVRELPVGGVGNLQGVERDAQGIWLVWQWIEGVNLEQFLAQPQSEQRSRDLAAQLKQVVTAMHAQGIVHGAIHARNVIVGSDGKMKLTHVSPLLFDDPSADEQPLAELLARLDRPAEGGSSHAAGGLEYGDRLRVALYFWAIAASLAALLIFGAILWYIRA